MATAQEILNEMEEVEEQNVIVIDSDLRTIRIPDGIKILGVESDDDVLRLHFKMPKMYGEFDLSTFALRVNYLNANGDGDVFEVQDAAANGDELKFSWLVGRTAAQYKGDVKFIVCAKKVKEGGIVEKEFNTTPATLPVLEGLETIERVAQENPDVIEAILLRLDKLEKNGGGAEPDATLAQSGKAADAKATGDALNELKEANEQQDEAIAKKANDADLAEVAKSGSYNDLTNKPTIPTVPSALKNPNKLTFKGAVTAEYDGSTAVEVTIPEGSGGSGGGETYGTPTWTTLATGAIAASGTEAKTITDTGVTWDSLLHYRRVFIGIDGNTGTGTPWSILPADNKSADWAILKFSHDGSGGIILKRVLDGYWEVGVLPAKNVNAPKNVETYGPYIYQHAPEVRFENIWKLSGTSTIKFYNDAVLKSDAKWSITALSY